MNYHNLHENLLQFPALKMKGDLFHLSTTCKGGVSQGNYKSFNFSSYSGDKIEHVSENRNRLAGMLGIPIENILLPYQVHGDSILVVDERFFALPEEKRILALNGVDALITDQPGYFIGVLTADCVPIIIYDPVRKVFTSVHAGWRGIVAHIVEKSITKMTDWFGSVPEDLFAGIAPSISPGIFEVGDEVGEEFRAAGFDMTEISYRNFQTGKLHIDLRMANQVQLIHAGVRPENIEIADLCTFSNPDMFFSARRQTIRSGRMVTGGMILSST